MQKAALWLVVIGGINWGLVGLGYFLNTDLNIVHMILGSMPAIENAVYVLVGLSALWVLYQEVGMGKK